VPPAPKDLSPENFFDDFERIEAPVLLPRQKQAYRILVEAEPETNTLLGYGGGMGGGKSIFMADIAYELMLANPGTRIILGRDTLESLKETTMRDFFQICPPMLIQKWHQSEHWVKVRRDTWPKGVASTLLFQGLHDYQKLGSGAYQYVLIDEAHEVPANAFRFLLTRLRHKLPKVVEDMKAKQCRFVYLYEDGGTGICGRVCPLMTCPNHGTEWIGNKTKYGLVATSNPWPGWFTDIFWKRELDEAISGLEGVKIHFVQALMRDNSHLPKHYEALATAGLTSEERRRFIDGEFGVFSGMVYEGYDRKTHSHHGPIPPYTRVIGGLDFGQESSSGHYTTGVVSIVTANGRIITVDEFKKRGADVYKQQGEWMIAMQEKWGKPIKKAIEWRGDKSAALGIKFMKDAGFSITKSNKAGLDSVDAGIKHVATFLNKRGDGYPGWFHLAEGHEMGSVPNLIAELKEYRRHPETLKVIKEKDDVVDAWRYSFELLSSMTGDPSKLFKNALPVMA
jgi:phage terminase large subunit